MRIGAISVRSSGWVPALELRDVVLSDPAGGDALRLPRVAAALSPRSLLVAAPRLSQLYVEGARLLVRRDAAGRLHVGGLDVTAGGSAAPASGEGSPLDWVFEQEELVLRHGTVRWVDERRAAPPLELADVDIVVRNGLRSHDLRIDATPPAGWGERATVRALCRQPLFAPAGDWRRWSGTLYAALPRGDVAQLRRHVDLPFELDGGQGALHLWLDFDGPHWRSATADVQLQDVALRLSPAVAPLALARAGGRLTARRDSRGIELAAHRFGFSTRDGATWPESELALAWRQRQPALAERPGERGRPAAIAAAASAPAAPITGGRLSADHLDLALLHALADALPLPADARHALDEIRPEGTVREFAARWDGPPDAPTHYRVDGNAIGLGLAAGPVPADDSAGRPGVRNATLDFDASETGGVAHLAMDDGAVELPGVFDEPLVPLAHFGAAVNWSIGAHAAGTPPPVTVRLRDVHFANADAEGDLDLVWRTGAGPAVPPAAVVAARQAASGAVTGGGRRYPGLLDLTASLARGRAAAIGRYLPRTLPADVRGYVGAAFAGNVSALKVDLHGDLGEFPFTRGRPGTFKLTARLEDAVLDYLPGAIGPDGRRGPSTWPGITDASGELELDRDALGFHDVRGRIGALALTGVRGTIPSLSTHPTLTLDGQVDGPAPEYLRFVAQSPVGNWLHAGLARTTAAGDAHLGLALTVPLQAASSTRVLGTLVLPGNDVRPAPGTPLMEGARARIEFTEHGVAIRDGAAHLLGGDARFEGATDPDGTLRFTAQGTATAEGLRHGTDERTLTALAQHLAGSAAYKLQLGFPRGQAEFTVTSPLTGMALDLPAPLNKPADGTWPLRVATTVATDTGPLRDTWRIDLGHGQAPLLQAEVVRDIAGPSPRPLRAAYALGAPLPAPVAGGTATVRWPAFDGDRWWAFLRDFGAPPRMPAGPGATPAVPLPPVATPDPAFAADDSGDWLPRTARLQTGDLLFGGRHVTHVDIGLTRGRAGDGDAWRADVASDQTHGVVEYRLESPTRGATLYARLDRLALDSDGDATDGASGAASGAATAGPEHDDPASTIPALDIVVDDFQLNAKKLGKLEVAATLRPGGRDWRLTRLAMTTPEARLTGTGDWSGAPDRRMALDFHLDLSDSGAFLQRLDLGRVLKGGKGSLAGQVTWIGSPLSLDYPSLRGQLKLALDAGQFLKADAGAGRLLGVLSLQSIPRRLTLDFRDVFQEGFAFDSVEADVAIERGVAQTHDFRMRGVVATVLIDGRADLRAETQDLRVIIVPEVNAGAASLAYAAINPVIGLGTFLAQLFLRDPLARAGTRELHVSGSWAEPKVDELDHREAVEAAAQVRGEGRAGGAPSAAASAATP